MLVFRLKDADWTESCPAKDPGYQVLQVSLAFVPSPVFAVRETCCKSTNRASFNIQTRRQKPPSSLFLLSMYILEIKASPSAIGDHISQSGHAASLEDFSVLDRANNGFDLLIHESLLILRDRPSLNSQQPSIPLALF